MGASEQRNLNRSLRKARAKAILLARGSEPSRHRTARAKPQVGIGKEQSLGGMTREVAGDRSPRL